jgi:O-antigen/teichoic acid export membrane protein
VKAELELIASSELPVVSQDLRTQGLRFAALARDVATMGSGTAVAAIFNVLLVFLIPRLVNVEDYGYWRLFMLYAGYVGFLHLGFADGALLRWAGRPLAEFHHELRPAMKYLFWQHIVVLAPACLLAALLLMGSQRFVGIAVGIYALMFNQVTLLQFGLQSAKIFRPVAISTVAAPALFLGFVLLWHARWPSDYRQVIGFYAMGWLVALGFLLVWTKPWSGMENRDASGALAKECLSSGWPILMANTGVITACADRFAVSWAATIQDFAQYSLAASAIAVPIMAIQACSKVFFSHLAGVTSEGRKRIYGISSCALLIAWTVLLPYYFALLWFIRHYLPQYMPSVEYSRILLLGIPFVAVIQILQTTYAYLNGIQKQFLVRTLASVAVSLGVTALVAFHAGSLRIVAGTQVTILGSWWLFNEWMMRDLTGQTVAHWSKFLGVFGGASLCYWLVVRYVPNAPSSVLLYYSSVGILLLLMCRAELRLVPKLLAWQ